MHRALKLTSELNVTLIRGSLPLQGMIFIVCLAMSYVPQIFLV
jgi:hypothetical protein